MRKSGTFRRLSQPCNRAGNNSAPSRPASAAAVFFRTPAANPEPPPAIRFPLPRIGRPLPATSFPVPRPGQFCPQFESVRRVFERLCLQFFRLCPQFDRACREFASACLNLQSSAAKPFTHFPLSTINPSAFASGYGATSNSLSRRSEAKTDQLTTTN